MGKVIRIDIWRKVEISGNNPKRPMENARVEGVADKIEFKTGNILAIPFDDETFNLVTRVSVINNLQNDEDKLKALKEIRRVLRPEGKLLLVEPLRDLRGAFVFTPLFFWIASSKIKWIKLLEDAGFDNLEYEYFNNVGIFLVKKHTLETKNSPRHK